MGLPHHALLSGGLVEPSLASVGATLTQTGTKSGGPGPPCDLPYQFEVDWTINDSKAGYTITVDAGFDTSNPPTQGSRATGLALGSSPYTDTWDGLYGVGGGDDRFYRATVKIVRTSDSQVVDSLETSVLGPEASDTCIV